MAGKRREKKTGRGPKGVGQDHVEIVRGRGGGRRGGERSRQEEKGGSRSPTLGGNA